MSLNRFACILRVAVILLVMTRPGGGEDVASKETVPPNPVLDARSTLSWQSAFWAVVAIAFNTMAQPSGSILGLSASWNFMLKISPVMCLAEALQMLYLLCYALPREHHRKSIPYLATLVLEEKFKGTETAKSENTDIIALQRNKTVRVTFFILAALPQAIKIYACRGIPLIKTLISLYLASFVVQELLCLVCMRQDESTIHAHGVLVNCLPDSVRPKPLKPDESITSTNGNNPVLVVEPNIMQFCFILANGIMLFIMHVQIGYNVDWSMNKRLAVPLVTALALLPCLLVYYIVWPPLTKEQDKNIGYELAAIVLLGVYEFMLLSSTGDYPVNIKDPSQGESKSRGAVAIMTLPFWLMGPPCLATYMDQIVEKREMPLAMVYFGMHVLTGLFWLLVVYDPSPTYKPRWTEVLG